MKKNNVVLKKIMLYFGLVVLVFLLFLPLGLRLSGKDLYKVIPKKADVINTLSCTRVNETLNTSYLNGKPYTLTFLAFGDFTSTYHVTEDENADVDDNLDFGLDIKEDISDYASISYDVVTNTTKFTIDLSKYSTYPSRLVNYALERDKAIEFYQRYGFSCTKQ